MSYLPCQGKVAEGRKGLFRFHNNQAIIPVSKPSVKTVTHAPAIIPYLGIKITLSTKFATSPTAPTFSISFCPPKEIRVNPTKCPMYANTAAIIKTLNTVTDGPNCDPAKIFTITGASQYTPIINIIDPVNISPADFQNKSFLLTCFPDIIGKILFT